MSGLVVVLDLAKRVSPATLVAGLCLISVGLLSVLVARWRLLQHVLGELEHFRVQLRCFEGRCALVLPYAEEYTASLELHARNVHGEIREMLRAAHLRLFRLEQLLARSEPSAVREAARLLRAPLIRKPLQNEQLTSASLSQEQWEERLEELLQELGGAISDVSFQAHQNGHPHHRPRRPTHSYLAAADIRRLSEGSPAGEAVAVKQAGQGGPRITRRSGGSPRDGGRR